jgi:hypothetical protein
LFVTRWDVAVAEKVPQPLRNRGRASDAGKVYTYITYPNEGHGFIQRDHRLDADQRELAFLNKYPKPDSAQ